MAEEDLGGGIYLTGDDDLGPPWDMDVDSAGDVATIEGFSELEKDLAYATTVRLQNSLGQPITPITLNRIRARVQDAMDDEPRIENVRKLKVREVENERDTVEVISTVQTTDGTFELVFTVSA